MCIYFERKRRVWKFPQVSNVSDCKKLLSVGRRLTNELYTELEGKNCSIFFFFLNLKYSDHSSWLKLKQTKINLFNMNLHTVTESIIKKLVRTRQRREEISGVLVLSYLPIISNFQQFLGLFVRTWNAKSFKEITMKNSNAVCDFLFMRLTLSASLIIVNKTVDHVHAITDHLIIWSYQQKYHVTQLNDVW